MPVDKPELFDKARAGFGNSLLFETTRVALRELGFRARAAIHSSQLGLILALIHAVLTLSAAEAGSAGDIMARFAAAHRGVARGERGRMIDAAVVGRATETLARATDSCLRSKLNTA